MATSTKAKIMIEQGATISGAFAVMTDAGDHKVHTLSGATLWSNKENYEPDIRPNGIVSGRNLLSVHATNNTVTVAGFTAYSGGTLYTVTATTDTITRPATAVAKVNSIVMTDAGAIDVIAGTDGATTTFSETRGAAGGPPEITADYVEIGQIRVTSDTAAAITADEIFQVDNVHNERFDYPTWEMKTLGDGLHAESAAKKNAYIEFNSALPAVHTTASVKKVYAQVYVPTASLVAKTVDFVPAETSSSGNTEEYYDGQVSGESTSLSQATFTVLGNDGVTDAINQLKGEIVTVWFYQNKDKAPYTLSQGRLRATRSFPKSNQVNFACTLTTEQASVDFYS